MHNRKSSARGLVLAVALAAALAACQTMPEPGTPAVRVYDQEISRGTVTVDRVISVGAGWIVVHADAGGKPGPVLGAAAVKDGVNRRVEVRIDQAAATRALFAMLHTDAGVVGVYEFPGADRPVMIGDSMVSPRFRIVEPAAASSGSMGSY